jgi:pimeloyl-ACP methyl ester carboxylesterase
MAYPLQTIEVPGGKLEYCRFGTGQPLVLITGYGGTICGWDSRFLHALASKHEVIVFNNRNAGNNYFISADYKIEDLADDVEKLRLGLNLGQINLGGLSMGGAIAQYYAVKYPHNLKRLILINALIPGSLFVPAATKDTQLLMGLTKKNTISTFKLLDLFFPKRWQILLFFIFHFQPKAATNKVMATTIQQQKQAILDYVQMPNSPLWLNQIKCNTLILAGTQDKIILPINAYNLQQSINNSQLTLIKKGGHLMIYQYPLYLVKLINNFLLKI